MNQKFKTLILWALPIILVIALSYQFLSSSNVDSLKSNGTTVAPRNSAVARVSYGRFLDYINSGRVTSVDIFEGGRNAVIETIDCLLYTSPSPRDGTKSRMPSSA